jgi:ribosomal protein S11
VTSPADDAALATFEEAADTLDRAAADTTTAARGLRRLRGERMKGRPWREVLGRRAARNVLDLLTAAATQLSAATGRLRRAIARALFADGLRVKQIAEVLDVSHQRVTRILGPGHARPPRRG